MKVAKTLFLIAFLVVFIFPLGFIGAVDIEGQRIARQERQVRIPRDETTIMVRFAGENRAERIAVRGSKSVEDVIAEYKNREDVLYAEPNYLASIFAVPNDPFYSYQWHLQQIGMEQAWDISTGSGVIVAVIDTGIAQVPDLAGTSFVAGYDFANNDSNPTDDNGHGTHVAGTIAQSTNNSLGVSGMAYDASLMAVKALNSSGSGSYADIADAIRYAADNGAHIISMSLGGPSPASYLEEALQYAYNKGVTIVAATGNDASSFISFPAAYNAYVIAVGATRYDKQKAYYSNYGSGLDVMAPGGDTSVDQNNDGYVDGVLQQTFSGSPSNTGYYFYQGTSMATPHVAGLAALLIAAGVAITPSEIRTAIESSAEDLGPAGWDSNYGHGLINAASALQAGSSTPPTPPPPPPPPAPAPSPTPAPPPPPPPASSTVVFTESFENDLDTWTQDSQGDWRDRRQRATDGRYSAEVDGRASNAQLVSPNIGLQGYENATIEFDWYIEQRLDTNEYVAFDTSTDGGSSWQEQARLRGNQDPEETWHSVEVDVLNAQNVRIRYRATMSASSEDANVDDIIVTAW